MEAEVKKSGEYHERARKMEEVISLGQMLHEQKRMLDIEVRRSKVLADIESATGLKFNVMTSGPQHVGGFAELDKGEVTINEAYLDDDKKGLALKIAGHEKNHLRTKVRKLEVEEKLSGELPDYLKNLRDLLGKSDIDEKFLMEGFNELLTERDYGFNEHCKYNDAEVPAARKLERLCLFNCGVSLLSAYEEGDKDLFFRRLKVLCAMLSIKGMVDKTMQN